MVKRTIKIKARKAVTAKNTGGTGKIAAAKASNIFKQPFAVLQNSFSSVMNYFK